MKGFKRYFFQQRRNTSVWRTLPVIVRSREDLAALVQHWSVLGQRGGWQYRALMTLPEDLTRQENKNLEFIVEARVHRGHIGYSEES